MKRTLLTLAAVGCLGALTADAAWVRINTASELQAGVDYIIVCEYQNSVMSATPTETGGIPVYRLPLATTITDQKIDEVPAGAARIRLEKVSATQYALHQVNEGNAGYLYPASTGRRTLGMTATPSPNTIKFLTAAQAEATKDDSGKTLFTEGAAVITSTIQPDKNILGVFLNNYQYCDQNDMPIYFYKDENATGYEFNYPVITPASGSTVDQIEEITVEINGATGLDFGDGATTDNLTITLNGEAVTNQPLFNVKSGKFYLTYRNPLTAPGDYVFKLGEGFLEYKNSKGVTEASPAIEFKYTIKDSKITYTFDPIDGSTVEEISMFKLNFDATKVEVSDNATQDSFKAYKDGTPISAPTNFRASGNTVTIAYTEANTQTEPGTYTFSIAEGTFDITSTKGITSASPAITYTLVIAGEANPLAFVTNPGNDGTIKEFSELTIEFPEADTVAISANAEMNVTKEGETDNLTTNFNPSVSGKTVTVTQARESTYTISDGKYTFEFAEGSFLINGTEKSPAISVTFTIDSSLVEGAKIMDYYMMGMPEHYMPLDVATSDYGMNEVMIFFSDAIKINPGCADNIVLKYNGNKVAEIPAGNNYMDENCAEVTEGGPFGVASKAWLTLKFGEGERLDKGAYSVVIPNGFFISSANEILNGTTLDYSIGLGTFAPAEGSTVDLKAGLDGVVIDNKLAQIKLTPYYSQFVPNDKYVIENEAGTITTDIPGVEEKAVLTTKRDGKTVTVAEFALNTPAVAMQRGAIVFSLRNGGNSPLEVNGDYTLTFPEKFFRTQQITDSNDNATVLGEMEFETSYKFTVTGGREFDEPEQNYTLVSPAAGGYNQYPTVTIKYDGCQNISVNEGAKAELWYGSSATAPKYYLTISAEGNEVTFTPESAITEAPANEYVKIRLVVPADSYDLTYNGKAWSNYPVEIEDYTIKAPTAPALAGKEFSSNDLSTFELNFEDDAVITNTNSLKKVYLEVENADGTWTQVAAYNYKINADKNGIVFTVKPADKDKVTNLAVGNYRLSYVASLYYVTVDGKRINNAAGYAALTLGTVGVDGVDAEQLFTVYTLTGIRVLNNADADALKALTPGFYIINGKKTLVK